MFRYDKQIEVIQVGQTLVGLRLRFGQTLGCLRLLISPYLIHALMTQK